MDRYLIDEKQSVTHISGHTHKHADINEEREFELLHRIGKELKIKDDHRGDWRWKAEYDETGARKFNVRIEDVIPYSDVSGGVVGD